MKFDFHALTVIAVSVAGSWTGLSVKYDRKLSALSQKIDTCSKGGAAPTSTDSDILAQVAEATKLSNQSLETSERVERRLKAKTETKQIDERDSPFTKEGDGWWVAAPGAMFLIPGGLVIGERNAGCNYGEGVLSVEGGSFGYNCPSGEGSVTFGHHNTAAGLYSSVTGGNFNTATGPRSSITGGYSNKATEYYSSVTGGVGNTAKGGNSSVSGGKNNVAAGIHSSVTGGSDNTAEGDYSTVSGGKKNAAAGEGSSILGGSLNSVSGKEATVSGGSRNQASGDMTSVSGGFRNTSSGKFASVLGGKRKVSSEMYGTFPE
mmetsp:Transcript_19324/g.38448  ORF Transcript_19324/g.38448 Transcript_19324/m.38448 type:complete len:319 (-) Transcript_19324:75-1031(-)